MSRIRTIKPEFWTDETVGCLPLASRLLFIATWNLADDEGLVMWTSAFLKASVYPYDDKITVAALDKQMLNLTDRELVYPYAGGPTHQQLAYIVNFHRHQRINRPQPSKLPPPSLQNVATRLMYARRDRFHCHLCGGDTNLEMIPGDGDNPTPDHLIPRSGGGSDHPSNIRTAHAHCNSGRPNALIDSLNRSVNDSLNDSVNDSVNDSLNGSATSREQFTAGREGKGNRREGNGGQVNRSVNAARPATPPGRRAASNDGTPASALALIEVRAALEAKAEACGQCDHGWLTTPDGTVNRCTCQT